MNYNGEQRRSYYRVSYPPDRRPTLIWRGRSYDVLDLSEQGVKFINRSSRIDDDILRVSIRFRDGTAVDVVGKVLRLERDCVAMRLIIGIPCSKIHQEQALLRQPRLS